MTQKTLVLASLVALLAVLPLVACTDSHGPEEDGGGADFTACTASSECIVVPASCCGSCGAATRGDAIAVSTSRASAYSTSVCPDGAACPACFMEQDPTLVATCEAGHCALVDVLTEPYAACTDDADCKLRSSDCCECGGDVSSAGLISIRADGEGAYMDTVCDEGASEPCPECAPTYPADAAAACDVAAGHCHVLWAR